MYSITTTFGFIIESQPYSEAGRVFSIFTRDLGLVKATAQGIRLEKSKLRYSTQLYSFGIFSFVKGKEFWRLTSAGERLTAHDDNTIKELIARLAILLCRLLHGEEAHPELFDCILKCVEFFDSKQKNIDSACRGENTLNLSDDQMQTLESLTVARILYRLGYIGDDALLNGYLQSSEVSVELLEKLKSKRILINQHVNKALKESHL